MVRYSQLEYVGGKFFESGVKEINPRRCPHFILMGGHYREDGSCKCDDPNEAIMAEWGYKWDPAKTQWISPD